MSDQDKIDKVSESNTTKLKRREFLKAGIAAPTVVAGSTALKANAQSSLALTPLRNLDAVPIEDGVNRPWLGAEFWANSLQHWELRNGSIASVASGRGVGAGRSCSLLTRELNDQRERAVIRARFRRSRNATGSSFTGFLFGVGQGDLDYRAAAIGQGSSGEGGGIVASLDQDGRLSFLDHGIESTDRELSPLADQVPGNIGSVQDTVILELRIEPQGSNTFTALLIASDSRGNVLGTATARNISANRVQGGLGIVHLLRRRSNTRWFINQIATGGDKISLHPERALGAVMGTMHSLSRGVLRMTAQFMPITPLNVTDRGQARLQFRRNGSQPWQNGPRAAISSAFVATFRMEGWDASVNNQYRIIFDGQDETLYRGIIRREPDSGRELSIETHKNHHLPDVQDFVLPPNLLLFSFHQKPTSTSSTATAISLLRIKSRLTAAQHHQYENDERLELPP